MSRWHRFCPLAIGAALLGGCGGGHGDRPAKASDRPADSALPGDWRTIATDADRKRLRSWREAWELILPKIARDPHAVAEGALLQPDAALGNVAPPPGDYACRVIKLGAQDKGAPDFAAYPSFACRIAQTGGLLRLTKLSGSQRPGGLLYADSDTRMVFLGTMVLGDETRAQIYGRDPERDMAGMFERIGPQRWRLVLPYPRWESMLDVIELVPAAR
jgi:hypothetical protein